MSSASGAIVVRPVVTDAEILAWHRLSVETFSSEPDVETAARRGRQGTDAMVEFLPRQRRGAFHGDDIVGGYVIFERWLRVGSARLLTGCIGSVMTVSAHRMGGVGNALMQDAIAYAEEHQHAQLLLMGIPNFYHRWGYHDVYDLTENAISRAAVAAIEGPAARVRPATIDDAPALLELYERHYAPYVGSFTRSLEQQRGRIGRSIEANNPPTVAVDEDGAVRGYILLPRVLSSARTYEVAADNWPAAAGLLRYHSGRLEALPEPPTELLWPLPPNAPTLALLSDRLTLPGRPGPEEPQRRWTVRSETYQRPNAGWMVRLVSLSRLFEGMFPELQARVGKRRLEWNGTLVFRVDGETAALDLHPGGIALSAGPAPSAPSVELSAAAMMQLVWGYRSITQLAAHSDARVSTAVLPVVDALFPAGPAWIPGSDGF